MVKIINLRLKPRRSFYNSVEMEPVRFRWKQEIRVEYSPGEKFYVGQMFYLSEGLHLTDLYSPNMNLVQTQSKENIYIREFQFLSTLFIMTSNDIL